MLAFLHVLSSLSLLDIGICIDLSYLSGVDVARRLSDLFSSAPFSDREESLFVNLEPPQNVNVRFPRNAADIYEGLDENVRQFLKQVKNATAKEASFSFTFFACGVSTLKRGNSFPHADDLENATWSWMSYIVQQH